MYLQLRALAHSLRYLINNQYWQPSWYGPRSASQLTQWLPTTAPTLGEATVSTQPVSSHTKSRIEVRWHCS